jgi:hypothetical protein
MSYDRKPGLNPRTLIILLWMLVFWIALALVLWWSLS